MKRIHCFTAYFEVIDDGREHAGLYLRFTSDQCYRVCLYVIGYRTIDAFYSIFSFSNYKTTRVVKKHKRQSKHSRDFFGFFYQ